MKLNIYEATIISRLSSYIGTGKNNDNSCWRQPKELARSCWMSERQLQRTIKSLVDKKIIKTQRQKQFTRYSFDDFWLTEVVHYSSHLDAVLHLTTNQNMTKSACEPTNPPNRQNTPIYNNKTNNKGAPVDNFAKPTLHPTGQQSEWVIECTKKHSKH